MVPLLVAAGLVLGVAVLANWDTIKDWLRGFVPKMKRVIRSLPHAAKLFVQGERQEALSYIVNAYYEKNGEYYEEKTVRKLNSKNDVPAWALAKMGQKKDITKKAEMELGLEF